jgi:hypothetical protein
MQGEAKALFHWEERHFKHDDLTGYFPIFVGYVQS